MNCPLGWNCGDMGLNSSGFCSNKGACSAIAKNLHNETHPDPDEIDALDYGNPYLSWMEGDYWRVRPDGMKPLPAGYAVAEKANLPKLPYTVINGGIEVVASDRGYAPAVRNPNFFLEIDLSPIVLIEWCEGEIRQIYTQNYQYWCNQRKDGSLLCSTDDGSDSVQSDYWKSEFGSPWEISFYGNPTRVELTCTRIEKLKPWLDNVIVCEDQHYCVICQEAVLENSYGSCECNHIHYCNWLGSWGGCGYGEEDLSESYRLSIGKTHPSVREKLKKLLEAKYISGLWDLGNKLCGDELEPAAVWIKSLDEDTPQAIAQTLAWLEDMASSEQRTQKTRKGQSS